MEIPVRQNPCTGFTLPEAAASVAIIGILAAIAGAAADGAVHAARAADARSALLDTYQFAIRHAATRGIPVVACPVDVSGACRDAIDWSDGWYVFEDGDGDRDRDAGEPVIGTWPRLGHRVHLRSTVGRKRLVFQPSGGNAGSNATFTLCDGRGAAKATQLVLSNSGALREAVAPAAAAADCLSPE